MKKRILASLLALAVLVGILPLSAMAADGDTFSDVSASDWYYTEVEWAAENGLMDGTGDAIFSPKALTNRGMLVTTLYRMEGKPEVSPNTTFTDVSGSEWYVPAVMWAAEKKIVEGYPDGSFRPLEVLTREQIAVIVNRYVAYKEQDVSAKAELNAFEDTADISDYAKEAMEWAVAAELINGVTETKLAPLDNATRAQLAVILYRIKTDLVPDVINDNDTPLAEGPTGGGGGGGGTVSRKTVTVSVNEGTWAAPEGWTANENGTYSMRVNSSVNVENLAAELPAPVREGYIFAGWAVEGNNLTANWTLQMVTVTVTLADDISWNAPEIWGERNADGTWSTEISYFASAEELDMGEDPTREGYVFLGWSVNGSSITARWVSTMVVSVDLNGGKLDEVPAGWEYDAENDVYTRELREDYSIDFSVFGSAVREGYTLIGLDMNGSSNRRIAVWEELKKTVTVSVGSNASWTPASAVAAWDWKDNNDGTYSAEVGYFTEINAADLGTPEANSEEYVFGRWNVEGNTATAVWVSTKLFVVDLNGGTIEPIPNGWSYDAENGVYTRRIPETGGVDLSVFASAARKGYAFEGFEMGSSSNVRVAQWRVLRTAETVTKETVAAIQDELKGIIGNGGAQLVEVEAVDGEKVTYNVTLNADAIMAGNAAVGDEMLNGLMTKIKAALDKQFVDYSIAVEDEVVYADKAFNNTALKNALFTVADGFFYTLANMQPDANGVYTYKTVEGTVANLTETTDTYTFDVSVQLKGDDVAKVQALAKALSDHLAMDNVTAAEAESLYGYTAGGENNYIVVTVEMPDTLMNKVEAFIKSQAESQGIPAEMAALQIRSILNANVTVEMAMSILEGTDVTSMLPEAYIKDANSLITLVNSNAAAVNKVLSKLEIKVKDDVFVTGSFEPGADGTPWQKLMAGINGAIAGSGVLGTTIGSYSVPAEAVYGADGSYYLVPVTVGIDLESSMSFTATETVLVVLHIPFKAEPEPVKNAETVTNEAVDAVKAELEKIVGNGGAQLVEVESVDGGYTVTLNADAVMANNAAVDSSVLDGLMTKINAAIEKQFAGYSVAVGGNVVFENGDFNNTALKNALFTVADGFFYTLANMKPDANGVYTYKTVEGTVASDDNTDSYSFDVSVQLKGEDVAKVQALATKLSENLAMEKLDAATVQSRYGYVGGESEYIVVSVEMPDTLMAKVNEKLEGMDKEQLENIRGVLNSISVGEAINAIANTNVTNLIPAQNANDVNSVLSLVNNNAAAVNKVLSKLNITIDNNTFVTGKFVPATDKGGEWQNFMAGIQAAIADSTVLGTTIGSYSVPADASFGDGSYYVVPVTVGIDLESSMDFTAAETVLVVLHIELGA